MQQIQINLLPAEFRKRERASLTSLLPYALVATILGGAGAFWGWVHYGQLAEVESRNDAARGMWVSKQIPLIYLASLRQEEDEYRARAETIHGIATSRVPWTRKLDQLADLVADDDGGDRFLVWLKEFRVKPPQAAGRATEPVGDAVEMEGLSFSESNALNRFNVFHEGLKQHDFFMGDFLSINNPAGEAITQDDGLTPAGAWTMKLNMQMRARIPEKASAKKKSAVAEKGRINRGK